jgi:hypothetical protein
MAAAACYPDWGFVSKLATLGNVQQLRKSMRQTASDHLPVG